MTSPIDPLRILKDRLETAVRPLGLEVRQFVTVVADEGSPDHVQVLFTIDEDELGKTEEQSKFDDAFGDIERQFKEQTDDDKAAEAKASLEALLRHHRPEGS